MLLLIVFYDKTPYHRFVIKQRVVKNNRPTWTHRDISYLEPEGGTKGISETYVTTHQPTWRHISGQLNIH